MVDRSLGEGKDATNIITSSFSLYDNYTKAYTSPFNFEFIILKDFVLKVLPFLVFFFRC